MEPTLRYPFNVRSFFTRDEHRDIGGGIELWRGFFQSIRPSPGRMLINVDISTGMMYRSGPLLKLCLDFLGKTDPNALAPTHGLPDRMRMQIQRFISGVRVYTTSGTAATKSRTARVVRKLTTHGAKQLQFTMKEGGQMTVNDYFLRKHNFQLRFPDVLCAEVGVGSFKSSAPVY